jgi:hypothetical protein
MKCVNLIFIVSALLAVGCSTQNFDVIPGQRIGTAVLGVTRLEMHRTLGEPDISDRLDGGVTREDWLDQSIAPNFNMSEGFYYKYYFLTVYFRDARAIQIEASSPRFKTKDGLDIASGSQKFADRYHSFTSVTPPCFFNPEGLPACKHFVTYDDAVDDGIAWRYGAWGCMWPEPDPNSVEVVIIHFRGEPVFVDPDGGNRLVWKIRPPPE